MTVTIYFTSITLYVSELTEYVFYAQKTLFFCIKTTKTNVYICNRFYNSLIINLLQNKAKTAVFWSDGGVGE